MENVKTSLLVPSQIPEWIRDDPDYSNFVLFVQAYYEWLELNENVLDISKNILNYIDIDTTTDQFLEYFINDFLQSFPQDSLISKQRAVKVARQLYSSKGTPASYKFLFRILYDSEFDYLYTKDQILRASNGKWYIPRSLKLSTIDTNFLNITDYRIFGETTKAIAVVENSIVVGDKTEVFITFIEGIQRSFQSGEYVRLLDVNNQPVLFNGQIIRAKIVGQVNKITIDPNNRGLLYRPGDPVILYGGLSSSNGVGAIAQVHQTTTGSLQRINVITGGLGYRPDPNTQITITNVDGASAIVGTVNPDPRYVANVSFISVDSISLAANTTIGNTQYSFLTAHPTSSISTKLSDAFDFISFTTYPISSILVTNIGTNANSSPDISATSIYQTTSGYYADLGNLGILGPIQISNGGEGYQANDTIVFTGGSGFGAYANVISVDANGAITQVSYVQGSITTSLGGMGYSITNLPTLSVSSANVLASNASLSISGILGRGASFTPIVDKIGAIQSIALISGGQDYISEPSVTMKVQDIVISNVNISLIPQKDDVVYQGANINVATYVAGVNSISLLQASANTQLSLYNLRVYNYTSVPDPTLPLVIENKGLSYPMANIAFNSNYNENGVRYYGDGKAKANASFINGLFTGEGRYLDSSGQLSSYDVLQDELHNNYTYQITIEKEISKYKDVLTKLIHPAGTRLLGKYIIKANSEFDLQGTDIVLKSHSLQYYTGFAGSYIRMMIPFGSNDPYLTDFIFESVDFEIGAPNYTFSRYNPTANVNTRLIDSMRSISSNTTYTNTVEFIDLLGANLSSFITTNSVIEIKSSTGPNIKSEIVLVDDYSHSITLKDNVFLTFSNVAIIQANTGENVINIISTTNSYDIINNGDYSNPFYPLMDVIFAGDRISIPNNPLNVVSQVDLLNNKIYLNSPISYDTYGYLTVNRTMSTYDVRIWNSDGIPYIPELTTEDGWSLLTEDGSIILLG